MLHDNKHEKYVKMANVCLKDRLQNTRMAKNNTRITQVKIRDYNASVLFTKMFKVYT